MNLGTALTSLANAVPGLCAKRLAVIVVGSHKTISCCWFKCTFAIAGCILIDVTIKVGCGFNPLFGVLLMCCATCCRRAECAVVWTMCLFPHTMLVGRQAPVNTTLEGQGGAGACLPCVHKAYQ